MGGAAMYKVDQSMIREQYDSNSLTAPSAISLHHAYAKPLVERLTSIHCNADDTLLSASGYTQSVNVHDLQTGQQLRRLKNIHSQHINLARFANMMPYLLLTCSFDQQICMFDLRTNNRVLRAGSDPSDPETYLNMASSPVPIYSCKSVTSNVMVTFSPNDQYFLSSGVDNEVRQYHVVDGKQHIEYPIPKNRMKVRNRMK